jgi:hypothetical protein
MNVRAVNKIKYVRNAQVSTGSALLVFHSVPFHVHMKTLTKPVKAMQFSSYLLNVGRYYNYSVLYRDSDMNTVAVW